MCLVYLFIFLFFIVIDCLHLQLYRDSRDRYKQGLTKASLSLQHFLGLETGIVLKKTNLINIQEFNIFIVFMLAFFQVQ